MYLNFKGLSQYNVDYEQLRLAVVTIIAVMLAVNCCTVVQMLARNLMQISRIEETRQAPAFSLYLMQSITATIWKVVEISMTNPACSVPVFHSSFVFICMAIGFRVKTKIQMT